MLDRVLKREISNEVNNLYPKKDNYSFDEVIDLICAAMVYIVWDVDPSQEGKF
jgi:hypothetical protein